jgi:uncharacterized protein (DUF58 family)
MPSTLFDSAFLKKLEMLTLAAHQLFRGLGRGERRSTVHGASVEFSDFRPYVQGDDFRRIDWNAYARFETLMLRLFVEEQDLAVHLLIDASGSMDYPPPAAFAGPVATATASTSRRTKFDYARRLAAALAYMSLANGDPVSLTPLGTRADFDGALGPTTGPIRGKPGILRVFETLDSFHVRPADPTATPAADAGTDLNSALARFAVRTGRAGLVLVISDLLADAGIKEGLQRLRYGKHEVVLIHVLAPEELQPELLGDVRLIDMETRSGVDVSATRGVLQAYGQRLQAFLRDSETLARQQQAQYVLVNTAETLDDVVLRRFRALGLVR